MAKKNATTIFLEYLPVFCLVKIINLIPFKLVRFLGRSLGRIASFIVKSRTILAVNNLQLAFPDKKENEIKSIVKECWENIGQTALEFVKIPTLSREKFLSLVDIKGKEYFDKGLQKNNGVILVVAHFCNWEMLGLVLTSLGYKTAVIVRPLDNPFLDKLVNNLRKKWDIKIIAKRKAIAGSMKHLKENGVIGILIDQYLPGGFVANFFGYPVKTTSIVSLLAKKTDAEVLSIFNTRNKNGFTVFIEPIKGLKESLQDEEYIVKTTDLLNKVIESWVRRYPKYWFWVHDRWRRVI